jgi:MAC/Perforin domain
VQKYDSPFFKNLKYAGEVKVDSEFAQKLNHLPLKDDGSYLRFIQQYGTHIMKKCRTGLVFSIAITSREQKVCFC